jgi:hypothetical protein
MYGPRTEENRNKIASNSRIEFESSSSDKTKLFYRWCKLLDLVAVLRNVMAEDCPVLLLISNRDNSAIDNGSENVSPHVLQDHTPNTCANLKMLTQAFFHDKKLKMQTSADF